MTDSTAAETDSLVLTMVVAAAPAGPRDADLISLHGLARCLALAVAGQRDLPLPNAGKVVCDALLGAAEWAGKPPASLPVYSRYATGPRRLDDECAELDGYRYKSERQCALEYPSLLLIAGHHLDEIPADTQSDAPAPRFLAVVREDALKAFGIEPQIACMRGAVAAPESAHQLQKTSLDGGDADSSSANAPAPEVCGFAKEDRTVKNEAFCKAVFAKRQELSKAPKPMQTMMVHYQLSGGYLRGCVRKGKDLLKAAVSSPIRPSGDALKKSSVFTQASKDGQGDSSASCKPGAYRKTA